MNEEKKVSVIIPVYNVESYLSECLESISGQTLKEIEIICVEDCSTDLSYDILKKYAEGDLRISILKNEVNKGLSYTRNRGLQHAKGKYVYFIDSDDVLQKDALENLYNESEKNALDVALFECKVVWEGKKPEAVERPYDGTRKGIYKGVFSGKKLIKKLLINGDMDSCVPIQFWKREFLQNNGFRFKEGILHEDLVFSFLAIFHTGCAKVISEKYYTYYRRNNSITGSLHAEKSIEGYILAYLEVLKLKNQFDDDKEMTEAIVLYLDSLEWEIKRYYREAAEREIFFPEQIEDILVRHLSRLFLSGMEKRYLNYISKDKMDRIRQHSEVIIYGSGMIAHDVIEILSQYNIGIHKVVVSEKDGQQYIYGHKIWAVDELERQDKSFLVLICVGRKHYEQILETLKERQFEEVLHVFA